MQSQRGRALVTMEGFFYGEHRATWLLARFIRDFTPVVAGREENQSCAIGRALCRVPSCRRLALLLFIATTVSLLVYFGWSQRAERSVSSQINEIRRDVEKENGVALLVFPATTPTTPVAAAAAVERTTPSQPLAATALDMSLAQHSAVCSDTVPTRSQLTAAAVDGGNVEIQHVVCCGPLGSDPQAACRSAPKPLRIPLIHAEAALASGSRTIDLEAASVTELLDALVFVTGASADHYIESLLLVRSLQKILPNKRLLYWDLGLKPEQAAEMKTLCGVDYRLFNASKYPPHVATLKTYAFKPLVMMESFAESPVLWWADASIRYTSSDLSHILTLLKVRHGLVMFREPSHSVFSTTYPQTYEYLATDPERLKYAVTVMGACFLVANTREIFSTVLFWFYACMLDSRCIAPVMFPETCHFLGFHEFAKCHRFDQSILTIIVANVWGFDSNIYRVQQDMFEMLRGEYGGENGDKNVTKCPSEGRSVRR